MHQNDYSTTDTPKDYLFNYGWITGLIYEIALRFAYNCPSKPYSGFSAVLSTDSFGICIHTKIADSFTYTAQ